MRIRGVCRGKHGHAGRSGSKGGIARRRRRRRVQLVSTHRIASCAGTCSLLGPMLSSSGSSRHSGGYRAEISMKPHDKTGAILLVDVILRRVV